MSSDQLVVLSTNLNKKYEVLEELGCGMHAVVFKAQSVLDGNFYALKVSRKTRLRSKREAQNKALLNESEILKTLSHKNIIKFFEVFEESSKIHVVLELIIGGELFHYLSLHKGITEWESQSFARQILNGICYIHNLNVAHLDLKVPFSS
uniref:Death-associated protein kinase 1 (Trinotate prediction) n=1 Tax=Myxobolus squamalis TaxID=59785 RepID=A0A6B2FX26_MYXSQ